MDKYLVTEAKTSVAKVLKKLSFWKDVLIIIQDIYDLSNERIPDSKKREIVNNNIDTLKYLLKKNNVNDLYVDMAAAGLQVALKHAGIKMSNVRI